MHRYCVLTINRNLYSSNLNNKINVNSDASLSQIELYNDQPYIDFHFNNSSEDYTSRIIEVSRGILEVRGACGSGLQTLNYNNVMSNVCTSSNALHFWWHNGNVEVWVDATNIGSIQLK